MLQNAPRTELTPAAMPTTGTSNAIGEIVAAGWRASSQPQAA